MKKSILMITLCAIVAFSTTSCKEEEKTGSEILSGAKNGWKLTLAVSTPAYEMSNGTEVSDLIAGFLEDCERDDIMYFQSTNAQIVNPGKDKKTTNADYDCVEMTEKSLGNWALTEDEKSFSSFYLPYFPGDKFSIAETEIVTLNETTLTVKVAVRDGVNDVNFALTYTKQ